MSSLAAMTSAAEQLRILLDGAEQVLPAEDFTRKVTEAATGKRPGLRVKFGMDPTSPDVHIGHTVVLRKLRQFQDLGHTAVLIIGGFTAQVGDPTGRTATRPPLTPDDVASNARTYLDQVRKVLRDDHLEVVDNTDWLAPLQMADVLRLTAQVTVAQMLERDDFSKRYKANKPIAVSEFLYPLLQGQDSVHLRNDIELGGTDQTFNLLMGRTLQAAAGQEPQCILTMPLLEGLDGAAKMSKTSGNTIGVDEAPSEMFGKAMSIRDELMVKYFRLVTDLSPDEVDAIGTGLADGSLHPGQTKRRLARELVRLYHSVEAATQAEERFDVQFKERGIPEDIAEFSLAGTVAWPLPKLLADADLVSSTSEARRMISQGAVRLDGEPLTDVDATLNSKDLQGKVLQVGKRRFTRLVGD